MFGRGRPVKVDAILFKIVIKCTNECLILTYNYVQNPCEYAYYYSCVRSNQSIIPKIPIKVPERQYLTETNTKMARSETWYTQNTLHDITTNVVGNMIIKATPSSYLTLTTGGCYNPQIFL